MFPLTEIAFVTLFTGGSYQNVDFQLNIENWVRQLHWHGIPNIVIMATPDVKFEALAPMRKLGARIKWIPTVRVPTTRIGDKRYATCPSKIHLWRLTEWKRVVYYDSDMFFLQSPVLCEHLCPVDAQVCAVMDSGVVSQSNPRYFNAGYMIIRPSLKQFIHLQKNIHKAQDHRFVEQDLFNEMLRNMTVLLPEKCNVLLGIRKNPDFSTAIALHGKLWELEPILPRKHWLRDCISFVSTSWWNFWK